jgi:hypothetical protein
MFIIYRLIAYLIHTLIHQCPTDDGNIQTSLKYTYLILDQLFNKIIFYTEVWNLKTSILNERR